ncbi:MAG: SWF/SNF helicase family protein, partial [Acidimicrobiaceae bacterium]|nr:SWF/SNF helicase family protein [Acidimicrobiaceae bacterium]
RGATDILSLVGLLGADNFEDETLQILERLAASSVERMDVETRAILRNEIQRFTVRRTKAQFNALVDREPELYPTRIGGRTCRYPIHNLRSYVSEETDSDIAIAQNIVRLTSELIGIAFLEEKAISPPDWSKQSQKTWLERRLSASRGLAAYDILSTLRSSRPALVEHILGTRRAEAMFDIFQKKVQANAGMTEKLLRAIQVGPPQVTSPSTIPEWLASRSKWTIACQSEMAIYQEIAELANRISSARELGKAKVLIQLKDRHDRVIAFDKRPITLHYLAGILTEQNEEFLLATGQGGEKAKERIEVSFGMDSKVKAIALCSDALNEGLNLQGASAVVHLDIPTTLRVAEQRVGRVDRIDSPYDEIDVYWPSDGEAFLTKDDRRIAIRAIENDHLLGSNIPVPFAKGLDLTVNPDDFDVSEVFDSEELDLADAFDPVRRLVGGENPLISDRTYAQATRSASVARTIISVVDSDSDWAFLSIEGAKSAIPRWMFIELSDGSLVSYTLGDVSESIRRKLTHHDPAQAGGELDERASEVLDSAIRVAQKQEFKLIPRRQQKAYQQMLRMVDHWAMQASRSGAFDSADSWKRIHLALKGPISESEGEVIPDFAELARCWIRLVQPRIDGHVARKRKKYVVLSDIEESLRNDPLPLAEVESVLEGLEMCAPLASRIKVAIVGVGTGVES